MTYQPYPAGGGGNVAERPPQPQPVRIAVILMYVGAALSVISLILTLAFVRRIKSAIASSLRHPRTGRSFTAAQIHAAQTNAVVLIIVVLLIITGLWVWMAWANNRGQGWARIVASVLFGLNTIWFLITLRNLGGPSVFSGLSWVVGLVVLVLLWRRDTTQYIAQSQRRYGSGGG